MIALSVIAAVLLVIYSLPTAPLVPMALSLWEVNALYHVQRTMLGREIHVYNVMQTVKHVVESQLLVLLVTKDFYSKAFA
jgi:hypothetical protein